MGIFKAYDIRGLYPEEIDEGMARRIGNAFARFLKAKRLVIGRDMRTHSPEVAGGVMEGIRDAGCDVIDAGLCSTPMAYYAIATQDCDGGLNVTASHNPGQYNGMKLCREGAKPISGATGIKDIEARVKKAYPKPKADRGRVREVDLLAPFAEHVAGFVQPGRPVKVAIDAANGMGAYTVPPVLERLGGIEAHTLFMELDGAFPNHEANPLKEENLDPVRALVKEQGCDLGVGFDGDADRCCFVDETGRTVGADLMTALLAREVLKKYPGAPIVYDLRSSWVVKEEIERAGGVPVRDRVGTRSSRPPCGTRGPCSAASSRAISTSRTISPATRARSPWPRRSRSSPRTASRSPSWSRTCGATTRPARSTSGSRTRTRPSRA